MITPWWTESTAAWIGSSMGGVGGLVGSTLGIIYGVFPGRPGFSAFGRRLALGTAVFSAGVLIAGGFALASGQPYAVWYPLVLSGGVVSGLMFGSIPLLRRMERKNEQRRLGAEELRRGG